MDLNDIQREFSQSELENIKKYKAIHSRLKFLQSQMDEIQDETNDLIETLDKMRIKDNK